jgi:hypothetical protein
MGAGTSAGGPAGLPLGAAFDALLLECCFQAASRCAPNRLDPSSLEMLRRRRCNLLTRLASHAGRKTVIDLLSCFRVVVPSEAQMLAAALSARGVLLLTFNVNDGIEQAHALLTGASDLPREVPPAFHRALDGWRRKLSVQGPLHVDASDFACADLERRPLLLRLRGSADAGWHASLVPLEGDRSAGLDAGNLSHDLTAALRTATDGGHLAIAGVSGNDRDCRASLPPLLRRGRFSWTCAQLDVDLVATLRAIDPDQPALRPAVEGVRALLPDATDLPAWPRDDRGVRSFAAAFERWRSRLPIEAAAATYGDLLTEVRRMDEADALYSQLRVTTTLLVEAPSIDVPGDVRVGEAVDGHAVGDAPPDLCR